jgi:hypothetical protein
MKKVVLLIIVIFMVLMSTSIPSFARDEPIILVDEFANREVRGGGAGHRGFRGGGGTASSQYGQQ